jgi:hypothetical protein
MTLPPAVDEALRQPGQVLAARDLEARGGVRELTVYDLMGGGARQWTAQHVAVHDVAGLETTLQAGGHATGWYDGPRPFVWRVTPGMVEVSQLAAGTMALGVMSWTHASAGRATRVP